MRVGLHAVPLGFACIFAVGCWSDTGDDTTSTDPSDLVVKNGVNLNGVNLNGVNLNGTSELGSVVAYVSYKNGSLGGSELRNVRLDGSQIRATVNHSHVSGTDLVGAYFNATSDTGAGLTLRVTAAFAPAGNQDPTTWRYFVEYQEVDSSWVPICVNGDTPVPSIPVDGWWDLHSGNRGDGSKHVGRNRFLFACEQVGAIGKCIEAGYRPWQSVDHQSLDKFHQTCVRLLRADFCGTSVPHTVDGSLLNIYDVLGVQTDTENWQAEAEWDKRGARCINPDATTADIANVACFDDLVDDDCGIDIAHRTLMITERP